MEAYIMPRLSASIRNTLNGLLPYWDPTTEIPDAFFDSDAVLPGFAPLEDKTPYNNGASYNVSRFTQNNFCTNYSSGSGQIYCNTQFNNQTNAASRAIDKFGADLECEHNNVHDSIGGVMANPQASPAAAIFWIWHAWVDEIYWDYEICNGSYASPPYSTSFNSNSLDNSWYIGSSNSFGRAQVTTANGPHSGSQHLTMDTNTNNNYSTNEAILNLNLSGMSNVQLSFWWKEWSDETQDQDGVYFSDGGPFVKVASLSGGGTTWAQQTLNISTLASNNGLSLTNTFKIKFQQYDNYRITTDGMAFDDISVTGTMASGLCTDFETGWDWWQNLVGSGDDINWERRTGSTPSSNTGPGSAFSGDYYIYLEATGNGTGYPSKVANLRRQIYNSSLNSVSFNYHMYGTNMGTLALQVSNSSNSGYTQIWSRNGNQGNSWQNATVTIPSSYLSNGGYYLRFVGTTGNGYRSDMALDNICFSSSSRSTSPNDNNVLQEDSTFDFFIYPNPVKEQLTINVTGGKAQQIRIYNMLGQAVRKKAFTKTIDVSDLEAGVYILEIAGNGILVKKRFIKK